MKYVICMMLVISGLCACSTIYAGETPDNDGDGLGNPQEEHFGTDPNDPDTDDDGINDFNEIYNSMTQPLDNDSDGDNLTDGEEFYTYHTAPNKADTDADSLTDYDEIHLHKTNPLNPDTDDDQVNDAEELAYTDPDVPDSSLDPNSPDTDGDGLNDGEELDVFYTKPLRPDTDYDGLDDYPETHVYHSDPNDPDTDNDSLLDGIEMHTNSTSPTMADSDSDGLRDEDELFIHITSPVMRDTDSDGIWDYEELFVHNTSPIETDSDNDTIDDGIEYNLFTPTKRLHAGPYTNQSPVALAMNETTVAAVWSETKYPLQHRDIFVRISSINLTPHDVEFQLNTTSADDQTAPDIATDGTRCLAVWQSEGQDNDGTAIIGRFIGADGTPDGPEFRINQAESFMQTNPKIASNGSQYLVVWESPPSDGAPVNLRARRIGTDGAFIDDEFVLCSSDYAMTNVDIASNGSLFVVVFKSVDYVTPTGEHSGILAVSVASDGTVSDAYTINAFVTGHQTTPSIASNGSGYLVVWSGNIEPPDEDNDGQPDGSDNNIYISARKLNSSGQPIAGDILVTERPITRLQQYPSVTATGLHYLVAWQDGRPDQLPFIAARTISYQGTFHSDIISLTPFSSTLHQYPATASYGGHTCIGWQQTESDSDNGLFALLVTAPLLDQITEPELLVPPYSYSTNPATPDTDNDSLTDDEELYELSSNPTSADSDADMLDDDKEILLYQTYILDPDTDDDGLLDGDEVYTYQTNPLSPDSDNDALSDGDEILVHQTDPLDSDSDNDGLSDGDEINLYDTNPLAMDTDGDSITDYDELFVHESDPLLSDSDNDGLTDAEEITIGSNPMIGDSDNDSLNDYFEAVLLLTDPTGTDTDNDGIADGEEWCLYHPESTLNEYRLNDQREPALAFNERDFLVVWHSYAQAVSNSREDIYARLVNRYGFAWGDEFMVNQTTAQAQKSPDVAAHDLSFAVVWMSALQDGSGNGVFARQFWLEGQPATDEMQVNIVTAGAQMSPVIASNDDRYLIAWSSAYQDGNQDAVYARFMSADGELGTTEFQINSYTSGDQYEPAIASDGTSFLLVWTSALQDGSGNGIYGKIIDDATSGGNTEYRINSHTSYSQQAPVVACNDDTYLVVWESAGNQDGNGYGIFARLVGTDGIPTGDELQVNTYTTGNQRNPQVAALGSTFVVTWESDGQDGEATGIYARRILSSGIALGDEFRVNTQTANSQQNPAVCATWDDMFFAWDHNLADNDGYDIHTMIITPEILHKLHTVPDNWALYRTNPTLTDTDNDMFSDYAELYERFTNPVVADMTDQDGDGLPDAEETIIGTSPLIADTDNDGLSDGDEVFTHKTNPLLCDSDGDNKEDGHELIAATDPADAASYFDVTSEGICFSSHSCMLTWYSEDGIAYDIYVKPEGSAEFILLESSYPSQGALTSYTDTGSGDSQVPPSDTASGPRLYKITVHQD